jgi:hypothetical protein
MAPLPVNCGEVINGNRDCALIFHKLGGPTFQSNEAERET